MSGFVWNDTTYEVVLNAVKIFDDPETAEEIACFLGSSAKHTGNRFKQDEKYWKTFSIVKLPAR